MIWNSKSALLWTYLSQTNLGASVSNNVERQICYLLSVTNNESTDIVKFCTADFTSRQKCLFCNIDPRIFLLRSLSIAFALP